MHRRRFHIVASVVIAAAALGPALISSSISCERRSAAPLPATSPAQIVFELELKPLTPLLPNRPTHVAVDPLGNIYWVQETDRADDTMFVIGEGDIPRATQLSGGTIAAAMNASGGRGNIQGIASGPGGEIYFYFTGGLGRRTIACVGQFTPKTSQLRILADTEALAAATGMGESLTLARGSVLGDGRNVWVWLRSELAADAWAVFHFDPRGIPPSGPVKLVKQFDAIKLAGGQAISP